MGEDRPRRQDQGSRLIDKQEKSKRSHPKDAGAFFGRRKGKALRSGQVSLFETLLPQIRVTINAAVDPVTCFSRQDFKSYYLEIGFGGGEHLLSLARAHPEIGFIGCEPFVNGMAKMLSAISNEKLDNIRVYDSDALMLLKALKPESFERVYLLYPDPWPKRRQHKRRFVSHETLDLISRALKPDGEFRFASDIDDYVGWTLSRILPRKDLIWQAERADEWRKPWAEWTRTRYEAKAIREGRVPSYLISRRVA